MQIGFTDPWWPPLPASVTIVQGQHWTDYVNAFSTLAVAVFAIVEFLRWSAVDFFGANRELSTIGVAEVQRWVEHLRALKGKKQATTVTGGTLRHHLNSLSNLFRRAQSQELVPPGFNPVAAIMPGEKPSGRAAEAKWLEIHEAALLLESARTIRLKRNDLAIPFIYPLIATFLLTGGRRSEVFGLEVSDVSFDRKTVTFRPNTWRRLKTSTSHRTVRLWPQLEEILRSYVFNPDRPPTRLLFPRFEQGREQMLVNFDKALDQVAIRAGFWEHILTPAGEPVKDKKGEPKQRGTIRTKAFRHTYCSTRLQTLDQGAPVSVYTVAKELGHGGDSLVKRVYGHLGEVRHRSELVEYSVSDHADVLRDRLSVMQSGRAAQASGPDLALSQAQNGATNGSAIPPHPVSR